LYEPETPELGVILRKLLLARKYLAYGPMKDCAVQRNHLAWVRDGDLAHPHGCVVIINNGLE
jgi:alpha-amylase